MASSALSIDQQELSLTIDMLHLPSDMLTEHEIKLRIELLESLLEEYETDTELIPMKLKECRTSLDNSTYFNHPEYFKSIGQNDRMTSEREETSDDHVNDSSDPTLIEEKNFPSISRHFMHWIGRMVLDNDSKHSCFSTHQNDVLTAGHLLRQLEDHLSKVEDAIGSGQLHKDPTLRKFFYVKIATTLHDIHGKRFSNQPTISPTILNVEDESATKIDEDRLQNLIENMVSLGLILLRMCYPPDTPQQTNEYLNEVKKKIRTECPFDVDQFIADDVHLLILLLGCSEINRTYLDVGLCFLYRWYDNLSDLGKDAPIAVARAFDIEKYCIYNHFRHKIDRGFMPPVPEYEDLFNVD